MLKRKYGSLFAQNLAEQLLSEAPSPPQQTFDNENETEPEIPLSREWKRYKITPSSFQRMIQSLSLRQTPIQTEQARLLSHRISINPTEIQGPLTKLPNEAYPLLDILTVYILCQLQMRLPEIRHHKLSSFLNFASITLAQASGTVLSQFFEMLLSIGNELFFTGDKLFLSKPMLMFVHTGSVGILNLIFDRGLLMLTNKYEPNVQRYNVCTELWKKLCKTETEMQIPNGSNEDIANAYYSYIFNRYGINIKSYANDFMELMQSYSYDKLLQKKKQLQNVYRQHPQSAHGLVIYYIFCYQVTHDLPQNTSEQLKCVNFFSRRVIELAQMATNESFRNVIVSIYATILTQTEQTVVFKALLLLLRKIYKYAEDAKNQTPSDPFLYFYLGLVWDDVETTVKHRLDLFCKKYPDICMNKPLIPLTIEEIV
jgi:hypothetical protein